MILESTFPIATTMMAADPPYRDESQGGSIFGRVFSRVQTRAYEACPRNLRSPLPANLTAVIFIRVARRVVDRYSVLTTA